ncbi:leucine-rich repeat-containing protein 4B-like [Schistocerca piceifrons]|uniref:leucine-rich repeat-containing protein 4B-like n=1 Tax=Schistocerca piceifrons TaxID=274613 RepID=UPI001F5F3C1B|nr:leucine-rich repeat-containing protein 4B-like [Schistocerca piceifrons]
METRALSTVARGLVRGLSAKASRDRRLSQPIAALLVVLALGFQSVCADAARACPAGCSCQHSGERVSCVGLTRVPRFLGYSPRTLSITQHRITTLDSRSFRGLERLEVLEITEGRLSEISPDAFYELRDLKEVNISHNELNVLPRDAFAECRRLELLDLSWNPLVLPGRGPMLVSSSLSALDMSFCSLGKLPDQVFSKVPVLSELRLRGNNLQLVSECILEPIPQLILLDADLTFQWTECSSQEATTSGARQVNKVGDPESGRDLVERQATGDVLAYAEVTFIPTLAQWVFLVVTALLTALLLTYIRKACERGQRREEHIYEILGGSQTVRIPITDTNSEQAASRPASASI